MNVGQLRFSGQFRTPGYARTLVERKFADQAQLKIVFGDWGDTTYEYPNTLAGKMLAHKLLRFLVGEQVNFDHCGKGLSVLGRNRFSPTPDLRWFQKTPNKRLNRMTRHVNEGIYFLYNRDQGGQAARVYYRA